MGSIPAQGTNKQKRRRSLRRRFWCLKFRQLRAVREALARQTQSLHRYQS